MGEGETLGKYLRQQRESKKVSLREVAKSTRVREQILKAIEEDHHHLLPSTTYVKGFLLAYAKYLSLNPNEVLLRYERMLKGEPVTPPLAQPQQETPQPPKPKPKRLWNTKQAWIVIGVIVLGLIGFYFFFPYSYQPSMESVPVKPDPVKPILEEKISITPSPPPAATTSAPEKKPFSLQFKAVEETWVSLQLDDQPEREMTFRAGEGISIEASNRIRILIGNAGGLDLVLNGRPLEKFGKSGEVLTLIFSSQGVEVKRHEKSKPE
jgi:cytoskeletal protein RodZ